MLDPDSDGYITESGDTFTSGTTELAEFEIIPNSVTGWISIIDIDEVGSDVTPSCGNSDLIQDDDGGDFAYYNIIDSTPVAPTSGDEYILFRFRLAKSPQGNFGYNFLVDTDASYGAGIDTNSVCGNNGFEREVQYANKGGKVGVSVYDVDGSITLGTASCAQCVSNLDVQEACAASSGNCGTSDPELITFPLLLSTIGIASDVDPFDLFISVATASSGNGTSVLGGGNVTDLGALDNSSSSCTGCDTLAACEKYDCQLSCINASFIMLPVTFSYFTATNSGGNVQLRWGTSMEASNDYFDVEHSTNGVNFILEGRIYGQGYSNWTNNYDFAHTTPADGINYYRLRQVDFDGAYRYSTILVVRTGPSEEVGFVIVPTVATDNYIRLELLGPQRHPTLTLTIFDAVGNRVANQTHPFGNSVRIDIISLRPGTYFVRLRTGETVRTQRFVKPYL